MFNLGAGEIAVIVVVALVLLGPDKLPELARGIGKFMREFRRQTDDVRGLVEREFYKMDQEVFAEDAAKHVPPAAATPDAAAEPLALPPPEYPSIFPPPEGVVSARPPSAVPAPTPETPVSEAPAVASSPSHPEPAAAPIPPHPPGEPTAHG